jgi:hypothetical protein
MAAETKSAGNNGALVASQVGVATIGVWQDYALADQQAQMTKDLYAYNNSMRAIMQGVKQFAADNNRIALADDHTNESIQIDLDRMRAEAQATTGAAFTGASSSARNATMFDINRNAAQAKSINDSKFETSLQQVQLSEYSDNMASIQAHQDSGTVQGPSLAAGITEAVLSLGDKSLKSGAWDKGGSLRSIFGTHEATLPTS